MKKLASSIRAVHDRFKHLNEDASRMKLGEAYDKNELSCDNVVFLMRDT